MTIKKAIEKLHKKMTDKDATGKGGISGVINELADNYEGAKVDLSDYYTKEEVNTQYNNLESEINGSVNYMEGYVNGELAPLRPLIITANHVGNGKLQLIDGYMGNVFDAISNGNFNIVCKINDTTADPSPVVPYFTTLKAAEIDSSVSGAYKLAFGGTTAEFSGGGFTYPMDIKAYFEVSDDGNYDVTSTAFEISA